MIFNVQHITARDLRTGDIVVRFNEDTILATEVDQVWHNPMRRCYEVSVLNAAHIGRTGEDHGIHRYHPHVELYGPRDLVAIIRNPDPTETIVHDCGNADTCFC